MREGRIPAQCVDSFSGQDTLSSSQNVEVGEIIHQTDVSQPPLAANYCNHVPFAPKLFVIPSTHKPRAKVVQETDKRLQAAYAKPKQSLKTLQFHDESGSQVRSQRREAAVALLQVMNYYQDDATGRIGRLQNNGAFRDFSLSKLAEYAGLKLKRAKRAMSDIINAGYMKVIRQFTQDKDTGHFKGLPSIRSFLPKFFIDLDVKGSMWTKWFSQRGWAKERMDKKVNKVEKKTARAAMGLIKDIVSNIGTSAKKGANKILGIVSGVPSVESQKRADARIAHEKKLMSKALELFNLDSSRGIGEYYKALLEAHPAK